MLVTRGTLVLLVAVFGFCSAQRKLPRTQPVTAEVKTGVNFDCPEEFGYYPHPTDCTQYYVCVFGGALLESCTGGLMYSHELQTCDWPRNVGCDSVSDGGASSTSAATSPPASTPQQHRGRYTPPPPPPQPAAIVTSRGQPRQLHHQQQQQQQQQEIIKQQQLYEDVEDLPPAEEVESDRQQRVYRGQPSTIGQVQRDRDGIRNSNAIPTYSGRAEKIGIISFGTGQQSAQPIQQYSPVTLIDVTNDLPQRRRRKRQAPTRSLPRVVSTDAQPWHGKMAFAVNRPSLTPNHPHPHQILVHNIPHSHQNTVHKFHVSSLNFGKQSQGPNQNHNHENDFQPFIPAYQNPNLNPRPKPGPKSAGKQKPDNFAYFNIQYVPKGITTTTLKYPQYYSTTTQNTKPQPFGFQNFDSTFSNFDHFDNFDVYNTKNPKTTEVITKKYPNFIGIAEVQGPNLSSKPGTNQGLSQGLNNHKLNTETKEVEKSTTQSTQIKPQFLSPPRSHPKLNLEEVIERIRENQRAKINQTVVSHYTTSRPLRVGTHNHNHNNHNLNDEYYYYDYEDDVDEDEEDDDGKVTTVTKTYSSQRMPSKPYRNNKNHKHHQFNTNESLRPGPGVGQGQGLADDEEYYYEEYDYPETTPTPGLEGQVNTKWETKYSSRYNEKLQNITTAQPPKQYIHLLNHKYIETTPNTLVPSESSVSSISSSFSVTVPSKSKVKNYITKNPIPSKTPKVFTQIMSTTGVPPTSVPARVYTVRQRQRVPSKTTTATPRLKTRHRQTTSKKIIDHDTRLVDDQTANRVEVTSVGPSQSSSSVTAATRALYNGSHHYDSQFDPYYNLYEDDVELYRDVDYSQQFNNNGNNGNTYRGTPTPSVQTSTTDEPKRGNSYIQNYNSQDLYQQSNVGDYNEDNRFNTQVEEQTYRQPARQNIRVNQNEENPIQRTTTTTTTTTTTSRPVSIYSSTTPLARSDANQTRAQSLPNTLPENPGHTLPLTASKPSSPLLINTKTSTNDTNFVNIDRRLDLNLNLKSAVPTPVTYRPKYPLDTIPDASIHSPVVNKPSPFSPSTTTDRPSYYHLTKGYKSTSFSNIDQNFQNLLGNQAIQSTPGVEGPPRGGEYVKRKTYYIRNTEPTPGVVIAPTTYAPPKFYLKSLLKTNASNLYSTSNPEYVIKSNGIKTIRKYINPIAINNVFASSTELYPGSSEDHDLSLERGKTLTWRGKVRFPQVFTTENEVTTYRYPFPTSTTASTTTPSTTPSTTTSTTPESIPSLKTYQPTSSTEQYRHFIEPESIPRYRYQSTSQVLTLNRDQGFIPSKFRNTVEIPQQHQVPYDIDDEPVKQIPDQLPSYKPKPIISTTTSRVLPVTDVDDDQTTPKTTTVTVPDIEVVRGTTPNPNPMPPSRVSRVNAAIKSMIGMGSTRGRPIATSKCSENPSKCGVAEVQSKQRTQTQVQTQTGRTRGSAHYTAANSVNNQAEPVNRGTPPSRSRPTLKPSTSIVSKAQEFVDVYRFPPRRPESIYPQPQPDKTAAKCRKDVCLLPDCSCGGKEIPGEVPVDQVPQIVLLTFDDSVNDLNKGLYSDLFEKGRVNPNGCPIAATFYVSHEWTDYSQVQNLYSSGHELASHTVSHSFGEQFSQKKWTREVAGQREILAAYGGVKLEDVRGMRAPFLSVGGNKMFKMLYDSNFTYDSSMPIYENKPPSWPYTLDYKLFHDCMIPPCPTRSYPGVWEVPMVMWQDLNGGRCSMGDACSNPGESEGVFKMLMKNFDRHYTTNRAPFGLFYHAAWFTQPHHKAGFIQFLDTINQMKDVFLVTNWQAIQWVRDPTPMSRINNFQPFQCNYADRPKRCNNPKVCNLWHKSGVRYMRTCQPCPDIYPWTGNTGIRSSRIDNDIED